MSLYHNPCHKWILYVKGSINCNRQDQILPDAISQSEKYILYIGKEYVRLWTLIISPKHDFKIQWNEQVCVHVQINYHILGLESYTNYYAFQRNKNWFYKDNHSYILMSIPKRYKIKIKIKKYAKSIFYHIRNKEIRS